VGEMIYEGKRGEGDGIRQGTPTMVRRCHCTANCFYLTHFWSFNPSYLAQEPTIPQISLSYSLYPANPGWPSSGVSENNPCVLFALVFLFFPIVYYVSHVEVYYRRQIDPLMVLLSVYGLSSASDGRSKHLF